MSSVRFRSSPPLFPPLQEVFDSGRDILRGQARKIAKRSRITIAVALALIVWPDHPAWPRACPALPASCLRPDHPASDHDRFHAYMSARVLTSSSGYSFSQPDSSRNSRNLAYDPLRNHPNPATLFPLPPCQPSAAVISSHGLFLWLSSARLARPLALPEQDSAPFSSAFAREGRRPRRP